MDCHEYIAEEPQRKRDQHLESGERGAIRRLRRLRYSLRQIGAKCNCSASTVLNELRRDMPSRKSINGPWMPCWLRKTSPAV